MKSIYLTDHHQLEIVEEKKPEIINPDDVLIRIKSVGVCGSDIHYYTQGKIGDQIIKYPFRIGHECAGIVEEINTNVVNVKPGDRVAIDPLIYCGKCSQCLSGRYHTCLNQRFLGCPGQFAGALAEYMVLPEKCCYKIPDSITYHQAVLSEPLSVALHALNFISGTDKTIAVLGTGPIGLSVIAAAKYKGISKIYSTDLLDYRNGLACEIGAVYSGNPNLPGTLKTILELEPEGIDAVFDCCGKQEALDQAIQILKPGGKLILVGIPEMEMISFNPHLLRRKEINIQNVRRQNEKVEESLKIIADKNFSIDFMITHNFTLEKTKTAFDIVENYVDGVVKAIIEI
jgi:L-iditol 2-dehydrogenase